MVIFLSLPAPPVDQSDVKTRKRLLGAPLKKLFFLSLSLFVSNCEVADKSTCGADGFSFVLSWGTNFEETLCGFRRSNTRTCYCVSSWRNAFDAGEWHNTQNAQPPSLYISRRVSASVRFLPPSSALFSSLRGSPNVTHSVNNSNLSNTFVKLQREPILLYINALLGIGN